jgi:mannose-6-phosphate isomerase class I
MKYDVKAGDVFYLPAGRVHAIVRMLYCRNTADFRHHLPYL